jgi:hypothetical protein
MADDLLTRLNDDNDILFVLFYKGIIPCATDNKKDNKISFFQPSPPPEKPATANTWACVSDVH